ncbi:MAG: ribonuclease P protein component [Bdellovibrionales bacterium]|nr:ribonuclease P protein component [Bdellovibrionales bacterium]
MDQAFRKSHRVRTRSDFSAIRRDAKKYVAPRFLCFYLKRKGGGVRLALSCSTRYGNSVERNRWKRWIREWFRTGRSSLEDLDLHFVARGTAPGREKAVILKYKQILNGDLSRLLEYLGR